jgi:hypothetical protein
LHSFGWAFAGGYRWECENTSVAAFAHFLLLSSGISLDDFACLLLWQDFFMLKYLNFFKLRGAHFLKQGFAYCQKPYTLKTILADLA